MAFMERTPGLHRRIKLCEEADKHGPYNTWRSGLDYAKASAGVLMSVLESARRSQKKQIAIIGIGSGRATKEIAAGVAGPVADGHDLSIFATGLTQPNHQFWPLGPNVTFVKAPVEELDHARKRKTFAAIVGMHSVAYALPDPAVEQIDQALDSGGVFLGTFRNPDLYFAPIRDIIPDYETAEPFVERFRRLGYDIATTESRFASDHPIVLLAIKPGGRVSARMMLSVAEVAFSEMFSQ